MDAPVPRPTLTFSTLFPPPVVYSVLAFVSRVWQVICCCCCCLALSYLLFSRSCSLLEARIEEGEGEEGCCEGSAEAARPQRITAAAALTLVDTPALASL